MKTLDWIVGSIVAISICSAWVLITYLVMPPTPQTQVAQSDAVANGSISFSVKEQKTMAANSVSNGDLSWIAWLAGALLVVFIIVQIVRSGYGAILVFGILGMALIGFIFWILLFRGGDVSTADARDENLQVIKVVQPVGNDPVVDHDYAEINKTNAGSNVVNAASVSIYTVLIWVTVIIFFGIGVFLWFMVHK